MSNVVNLPGVTDTAKAATAQPQPDVIACLEDLLERAKRGEVQAVAFTVVSPAGTVSDGWSRGPNTTHQLVAGAAYLQNRITSAANEDEQAEAPAPEAS